MYEQVWKRWDDTGFDDAWLIFEVFCFLILFKQQFVYNDYRCNLANIFMYFKLFKLFCVKILSKRAHFTCFYFIEKFDLFELLVKQ